ncbi:efflux RND transporter periplasmic adaptor subunit [Paraburkholderia sp. J67]|uniref:efflux RND transporter periplasmic adaptor subunit n=1 Tax=Paraburkholderia sp. J67 TaxID=2805435 RepID=UPI002ABD1406|nr:efflux RND transporter periplasmic adaptor subunit [Paraburkholderia sp. J67]
MASVLALTGCEKKQEAVATVPEVGVVTLAAQPVTLKAQLPGRTNPCRVAEVRPQVNGVIKKRLFTEGTDVQQGQQLYQIDDAPYRAAYDKAQAVLMSAKNLAERDEKLVADNAVSRQQYDDAVSAYRQAQADVETAKVNLDYTRVYAPISGRIGRSSITEGALVTSGQAQALAVITQLDPIYVDVTQSSTEMLRLRGELKRGQLQTTRTGDASVNLALEDGTVYARPGALKFSEVTVDEGTGSVTVRAEFPNPEHDLLPGMFVHASLDEGTRSGAILVPQQGVSRDTTGHAVAWVVNADNTVQQRPIVVDRTIGNTWLVNQGLQAGDRVVTEGVQRIQPGMKVVAKPASNVHVDLSLNPSPAAQANGS